jgi:hypothetical protein
MKTIQICGVMSAVLLLACKEAEPGAGELKSAELSPALRQVFETIPRGEAQEIHRLRTTAKEGDEVTVQGRIMGVESPFVDGRAICILGDPKILTPCNEIPGDSCETPWDVCCDSAEDKKIGTATLQIVDAEGRVLKQGLEGVCGMEKLGWVKVSGKVAAGSSVERLVIHATAIQVGRPMGE